MNAPLAAVPADAGALPVEDRLFAALAEGLRGRGHAVCPDALPDTLQESLLTHLRQMPDSQFHRAGIGRQQDFTLAGSVRRDAICWINGESPAGQAWLNWSAALQTRLNRELLLGLFSFESHFAHYGPGDFYRRHVDAFAGEANRRLSLVAYLNRDWQPGEGGELVLYTAEGELRVSPRLGTLVVFLSEEFPHEVLPAARDRYSIAGWFRVNTSSAQRIDPPR
ncbi:MAG: 2OG-Fe(II) oxygenase [Haliea sp.]|nr:2OG-Fe(II) oxygenase [Haliea sp.]|tara:strand:+ start:170828 stop:171496 length:669 start_codon:yes stop_codon:yes gene_type:complete